MYVTTIIKPHGVRGKVKVTHFDADIQKAIIKHKVSDGEIDYQINIVEKLPNNFLILNIKGIDSCDKAQLLVGKKLYIEKNLLPKLKEDEYYSADLIGTKVSLQDGTFYGHIINVYDFGAGDIVEIQLSDEKNIMLSFTKEIFISNDIANKVATIELPKFFDV